MRPSSQAMMMDSRFEGGAKNNPASHFDAEPRDVTLSNRHLMNGHYEGSAHSLTVDAKRNGGGLSAVVASSHP